MILSARQIKAILVLFTIITIGSVVTIGIVGMIDIMLNGNSDFVNLQFNISDLIIALIGAFSFIIAAIIAKYPPIKPEYIEKIQSFRKKEINQSKIQNKD